LPYTGNETAIFQTIGIKPLSRLQIDNTYILERVVDGLAHHAVVNSDIVRSKWNYQFSPEFSFRFIGQYNGVLTNPHYSSLQTTKNMISISCSHICCTQARQCTWATTRTWKMLTPIFAYICPDRQNAIQTPKHCCARAAA